MSNVDLTNITPPRVPLIDQRTGLISREWYRFFLNLFQLTGGGQNTTSLTDLQVGPSLLAQENLSNIIIDVEATKIQPTEESANEQIAELQKQIEGLAATPIPATVTSVDTGTGLTGGPITSSGTVSFAVAAVGTWAATPSSANLAAAVTDETGSGPLVFATQPVFSNTIGVGGATASASGSGVSFPATQSASTDPNTLDDYEEGTWTLTLTAGSGTITSYTVQEAKYTKIGNLVTAIIKFTITNNGTGGAYLQINLPFTSANECMGTTRENALTGTQGNIRTDGVNAFILAYDSNYPGATGAVITGTVTFNV